MRSVTMLSRYSILDMFISQLVIYCERNVPLLILHLES